MRLSLLAATLSIAASGLTATAASAASDGFGVAYYGLRGSYVWTDSASTHGSMFFDYNEEYAEGFALALYLGWVLDDNFRLEVEGGFRSADLDQVTIVRDDNLPPFVTPGQVVGVGGDAQVGTAMANLYFDLHIDDDNEVLPWIGAGLGGAFVDYSVDAFVPGDPTTVLFAAKDDSWVFAYQFMAGLTIPVGDFTSMTLSYHYFRTADFVYVDAFGEEFETDLTQHSVDLGFQFHL